VLVTSAVRGVSEQVEDDTPDADASTSGATGNGSVPRTTIGQAMFFMPVALIGKPRPGMPPAETWT
jgi:hypothetical protein